MGRFWIGLALLLLLLGLGLFGNLWMEAVMTPVSDALESAGEAALSPAPEESLPKAEEALLLWQRRWHTAAAFSSHTAMENIDALFARLHSLARGRDWVTFSACCRDLSQQVDALTDAQSFNWWSLL